MVTRNIEPSLATHNDPLRSSASNTTTPIPSHIEIEKLFRSATPQTQVAEACPYVIHFRMVERSTAATWASHHPVLPTPHVAPYRWR